MTRIPVETKDLIEVPIFYSMKKKEPVETTISEQDIQSSVMRKIYNGEIVEALNEFTLMCHEKNWLRDF